MPRPTKAKKTARLATKASKAAAAARRTQRKHMNLHHLASKDDELHFMIGAAAFATDMDAVIEGFFMSDACDSDFVHCVLNNFIANALYATTTTLADP